VSAPLHASPRNDCSCRDWLGFKTRGGGGSRVLAFVHMQPAEADDHAILQSNVSLQRVVLVLEALELRREHVERNLSERWAHEGGRRRVWRLQRPRRPRWSWRMTRRRRRGRWREPLTLVRKRSGRGRGRAQRRGSDRVKLKASVQIFRKNDALSHRRPQVTPRVKRNRARRTLGPTVCVRWRVAAARAHLFPRSSPRRRREGVADRNPQGPRLSYASTLSSPWRSLKFIFSTTSFCRRRFLFRMRSLASRPYGSCRLLRRGGSTASAAV